MNDACKVLELIAADILSVEPKAVKDLAIIMSRSLYNRLFSAEYSIGVLYETLFGLPLEIVNTSGYWWLVGAKRYVHLQGDIHK